MRLLVFTQKIDCHDGTLGFFHAWIERFAGEVTSVEVICLEEGAHALPANVHVHSLGKECGTRLWTRIYRAFTYSWSLRGTYDSVFVHMNPEYLILLGWMWRLMRKRIGLWYVHRSVHLRLRLGVFWAHYVFTASEESLRLRTKKRVVTGHVIDTDLFSPGTESTDPYTLVTIGRLSPSKNVEVIIDAVRILHAEGHPARLLIAGDAGTPQQEEYVRQLHAQVRTHKLTDAVQFLGSCDHVDVPEILRSASICINVSDTGSMDKAVLEAMAAGTLVLTSNEAFKGVLSRYGNLFIRKDAKEIAASVTALSKKDTEIMRRELRDGVIANHSLSRTIPSIIHLLT